MQNSKKEFLILEISKRFHFNVVILEGNVKNYHIKLTFIFYSTIFDCATIYMEEAMKEEKRNYYFAKILETLIEGEIVTIGAIANRISISEKTVRNKIEELNTYLDSNSLGQIIKKPRVGIWLECDDSAKEQIKEIIYSSESLASIQVDDERMYAVLTYIFKNRRRTYITTNKIAESLFLSSPTILKILKECEIWLKDYNIKLENTRSKGIVIIFNENGYRRAVQKIILHGNGVKNIEKNILDLLPGVMTDVIRKAILDTEDEWRFEFIDNSFYEILVYCCVSVARGNKGTIKIDKNDINLIKKYNEYQFAKSIFKRFTHIYNVQYKEEEIYLLALQLLCSKYLDSDVTLSYENALKAYDVKLYQFTQELIETVSNILGLDLTEDTILQENLILHLQSTLFRIKYGNLANNELLFHIKSEYKKVFRATWSLSFLFERYFDIKITDDELGFICLYIQAALERKENSAKILIVSNQSRSSSQLIVQKIKCVVRYLKEIKLVSDHDFDLNDYGDYDVIVTNRHLNTDDKRVLVVNEIIKDDWISNLLGIISKQQFKSFQSEAYFEPICQNLFSPELIFLNMSVESKEEALEILGAQLLKKGYVKQGFTKSVIDRENLTTTEIGGGIALPHGDQNLVNTPKVAIAKLEKPILWNNDEVDLIFLLAVKMVTEAEIKQAQNFYKQFIVLVDSDQKIRKFKSRRSKIDLYKYLIS